MAILSRIADEIWEQYRKGMRSCLADSPVRVTVRTRQDARALSSDRSGSRNLAMLMLGTLKTFIVNLVEDRRSRGRLASEDCRLAIAALLVRVASVNGEMSQARRGKLHAVLKSVFGLDYLATARLIDAAAAAERHAIDLYHFTRQLNENFDHGDRRRVVGMMWEILYADGRVNECEANVIWRASDLLGISTRERVELRQQIAANGARPVCT